MRVKMSKPPPPAPTASAIGPYPTVIKIVGRPGTGSLPSTIAPPDHPQDLDERIYGKLNAVSMKTCKSYFNFIFYLDIPVVLVLLESTIKYNHPLLVFIHCTYCPARIL